MAKIRATQTSYNQGYSDAINGKAKNYAGIPLDHLFYYDLGHEEGWPKRLIPTTIITRNGPITERCTLERAAYLQALNYAMPGGRR